MSLEREELFIFFENNLIRVSKPCPLTTVDFSCVVEIHSTSLRAPVTIHPRNGLLPGELNSTVDELAYHLAVHRVTWREATAVFV